MSHSVIWFCQAEIKPALLKACNYFFSSPFSENKSLPEHERNLIERDHDHHIYDLRFSLHPVSFIGILQRSFPHLGILI